MVFTQYLVSLKVGDRKKERKDLPWIVCKLYLKILVPIYPALKQNKSKLDSVFASTQLLLL